MTEPIARTVKEFCRSYGIGKTKLYELIGQGHLDVVKVGRRTLILEDSARAWLRSTHGRIHSQYAARGDR